MLHRLTLRIGYRVGALKIEEVLTAVLARNFNA